jgi:nitrate/nitrite transport system ATP-binding protein
MACLELQNVSKSYRAAGRTVEVLSHVNLQVSPGEFVAIVGYSGAGKTTLISLLAGLAAPDSGRALFEGRAMDGPGPERGVVFQNYSLLPWLSAYDNVRLAVDEVHAGWTAERRRRHIEACL